MPDAVFGFGRQVTKRASPTFLMAAWFPDLFWDGRARTTFVDPVSNTTMIPTGGALENHNRACARARWRGHHAPQEAERESASERHGRGREEPLILWSR
jgi:hypothetical protein